MLERNTTLETLELNSNAIDLKGITALAKALANNTSLKVLGLRYDGVCVCGACWRSATMHLHVCHGAPSTHAHSSDNYIGTAGAVMLSDHLTSNGVLEELTLKGNELGDDGLTALCKALQQRPRSLKVLDVGNNSLTEAGAAALAEWLPGAGALQELNVYMNDMGDGGAFKVWHVQQHVFMLHAVHRSWPSPSRVPPCFVCWTLAATTSALKASRCWCRRSRATRRCAAWSLGTIQLGPRALRALWRLPNTTCR